MSSRDSRQPLLAEELLLLAFDDVKGTVLGEAQIALDFGLAGALLMELTLHDALHMDGKKLSIAQTSPLDQPLLNDASALIDAKPGKHARYWVQQLPRDLKPLRQRLLDGLVERGVLQHREQRILFIFHRQIFPELDHQVESDARQRFDAVLLQGNQPDARTQMLIQLADSCRLIKAMYPREQRKAVRARIKVLQQSAIGAGVDKATQDAISTATVAAAMVAITAATAASTASACSVASSSC